MPALIELVLVLYNQLQFVIIIRLSHCKANVSLFIKQNVYNPVT